MFKIQPSFFISNAVYVQGEDPYDACEYGYRDPGQSAEMRSWFSAARSMKRSPSYDGEPTIEGVYRTEIRLSGGRILTRHLETISPNFETIHGWSYWSDGKWYTQSHTFEGAVGNFKKRRNGSQPRFWFGLTADGYEDAARKIIDKSLFPPISPSFGCVIQFQKSVVQYTIDVPLATSDVFEIEVSRISKPLSTYQPYSMVAATV